MYPPSAARAALPPLAAAVVVPSVRETRGVVLLLRSLGPLLTVAAGLALAIAPFLTWAEWASPPDLFGRGDGWVVLTPRSDRASADGFRPARVEYPFVGRTNGKPDLFFGRVRARADEAALDGNVALLLGVLVATLGLFRRFLPGLRWLSLALCLAATAWGVHAFYVLREFVMELNAVTAHRFAATLGPGAWLLLTGPPLGVMGALLPQRGGPRSPPAATR
jgi:hypothetical protein